MVLTPAGKLSKYFYGIEYAPRDSRLGSGGSVGEQDRHPRSHQLPRLFCLHYDPQTGKYSAIVMNIVRLGLAPSRC